MLKRELQPQCVPCQCPLTVEHILIHCVDFARTRQQFYNNITTVGDFIIWPFIKKGQIIAILLIAIYKNGQMIAIISNININGLYFYMYNHDTYLHIPD
jgi:hypothetical protein